MKPYIILYSSVSVDGRMDYTIRGDMGLYYEIANRWQVDAVLSGSSTILAAEWTEPQGETLPQEVRDSLQLLVVVDSRGRIHQWDTIRRQPYWRDCVVLVSEFTPRSYLSELREQGLEYIETGGRYVDLKTALQQLNDRYSIQRIRVDSGGTLNGVLLREGLVDELNVLINPELVGGTSPRSMYVADDLKNPSGCLRLKLLWVERLREEYLYLRYAVEGKGKAS